MGLEEELSEISGLQNESFNAKTKLDEELKERIKTLRKRIIGGESTGDSIMDFVIVTREDISPKAGNPHRQLQEMLNGKVGQQVLVVNEEVEFGWNGGCFGSNRYTHVDSTLRLGVLNSDIIFEIGHEEYGFPLFVHGPRIILPTERYVEKRGGDFSDKKWGLVERQIQISPFEFHCFNAEGEKTEPYGAMIERQEDGNQSHRDTLLIRVGEDIPKYFRSYGGLFKDDISYVEALDLLGIENQAPEDFLIQYNQGIGEAKKNIIESLRELTIKKSVLKKNIEKQYAKIGGMYENERGDGMVYSREFTENDAIMFSLGYRRNLNTTIKTIVERLESAIGLEMHSKPWILDGERPGETLDVQKYITTMCKDYEISLEQ